MTSPPAPRYTQGKHNNSAPTERIFPALVALSLIATALVYWPVVHAGFVWDDLIDFRDNAWLTHGHVWIHYVLRDFNHWTNYFRPLIVAFFTLQVRLFDVSPGPMHAVSLGMHLVNTGLVAVLAREACHVAGRARKETAYMAGLCGLLYGLHPVLIEPVAWIGCQFDLGATMFMLLGLLANIRTRHRIGRATLVALLFLLAAGCKESAIAFPLLLAVWDWVTVFHRREGAWHRKLRDFLHRDWLTFIAILVAGGIYLAVRDWALGKLLGQFVRGSGTSFAHLQEISFLYLHYWRTLFVPMAGMSPVHPVDVHRFELVSSLSLLTDAAAIGSLILALHLAIRHGSPLAGIVIAVTATLFPVLHVVSVAIDSSLYHERYVMTGLAVACGMLPMLRFPLVDRLIRPPLGLQAIGVVCLAWFLFAAMAIRTTVPLWSNSVALWRWALVASPGSLDADDNLLSAYLQRKDYADARRFVNKLQAEHVHCPRCMLNAAILAVDENDPGRALTALQEVRNSREILVDKSLFRQYLVITGQALVLKRQWQDAQGLFRAAIQLGHLDPQPRLGLAIALALQGRADQARATEASLLPLLPPDQRDNAQRNIERSIQAGQHPSPTTASP